MKFTPNVSIIDGGVIHRPGESFEIEESQAAEMSKYGVVEEAEKASPAKAPRRKKAEA